MIFTVAMDIRAKPYEILSISAVLLVMGFLAAQPAASQEQMVDIGGRRIHLLLEGRGEPTVIFESGFTVGLKDWGKVQSEIAKTHATMSYDRAGLGESELGREPRTADQISHDLHAALRAARVHPPYVLVGHSAGGLYIQSFAHLYSKEVRGLVFLDAVLASYVDWLKTHDPGAWNDLEEGVVRPASLGVRQQWAALGQSLKQVRAALPSPHVPTMVVVSDRPAPPFKPTADVKEWLKLQEEFAHEIPGAKLIVTHGGHEIPEEQPQLAINAIDQVIAAADKGKPDRW